MQIIPLVSWWARTQQDPDEPWTNGQPAKFCWIVRTKEAISRWPEVKRSLKHTKKENSSNKTSKYNNSCKDNYHLWNTSLCLAHTTYYLCVITHRQKQNNLSRFNISATWIVTLKFLNGDGSIHPPRTFNCTQGIQERKPGEGLWVNTWTT